MKIQHQHETADFRVTLIIETLSTLAHSKMQDKQYDLQKRAERAARNEATVLQGDLK